jgi:hypothetical protein
LFSSVNDTGDKFIAGVVAPVLLTPAITPCHRFSVIAGVVDTGDKFIAGDNDTSDKFIAGDNNGGD